MAGSFFSVALQEEAAVALCGFLSVPLTCRGSSNSREVSWWFRWRRWNTPSERDEANRLVPNPTMAAAVLARYTTLFNFTGSKWTEGERLTVRVGLWKSLSCNQMHDGRSAGRQL